MIHFLYSFFGVLFLFFSSILCLNFFLRKRKKKTGSPFSLFQWLKKHKTTEGKTIQVLARHHFDSKKSLAVVKIFEKNFILGISTDSIQMIPYLSEESSFADELKIEELKKGFEEPAFHSPPIPDARSRIKSRLNQLKPL